MKWYGIILDDSIQFRRSLRRLRNSWRRVLSSSGALRAAVAVLWSGVSAVGGLTQPGRAKENSPAIYRWVGGRE